MSQETLNILFNFLPEITLAVSVIILNITQDFNSKPAKSGYVILLSGVSLAALFSLLQAYSAPQQLFNGVITADHYSYGGRVIILLTMLVSVLAFYRNNEVENNYNLILCSLIGALLSISASNIFVLFITLQVMIIPLYLIIYYELRPAIKHYIFSSMFMAVMLYGFTLIYGITGMSGYIDIAKFLSFNPFNTLALIIAVIMITSGFAFISLLAPYNLSFPFFSRKLNITHIAQFAVINVITIMLVMGRFFITLFHDSNTFINTPDQYNLISGVNWQLMLAIISSVSIIAGNFVILWQYDLKKIASYIIISQAGYILMGIIPSSPAGMTASVFNLIVFAINGLGLMFCIKLISDRYSINDTIGFKGLGKSDKFLFLSFIFFLISSAGFPLSAGFTGKIMLYISLGSSSFYWLIVIGILSSAIFLYFIFRITVSIFSGKNTQIMPIIETKSLIILLILLIPNILFGFYFEPILHWAKYCSILFGI